MTSRGFSAQRYRCLLLTALLPVALAACSGLSSGSAGGAIGIRSHHTGKSVGTGGSILACRHRRAESGTPHADRYRTLSRLRLVTARHVSRHVRLPSPFPFPVPVPVPARSPAGRRLPAGGQFDTSRCADAWPGPAGVPRPSTGSFGSG